MKLGGLKTISQYTTLLNNLNPLGKYQLRLYLICILYWTIAGMYTTCFDLAFSSFRCPYAIGTFQGIGLLIFSWVSHIKGRKVGTFAAGVLSFIGFILCLVRVIKQDTQIVGTFGIAVIGLSVYAQPCLVLCIVCQITTKRIIEVVFCGCLAFYSIGRMWIVPAIQALQQSNKQNADFYITLIIIAPTCIITIILSIFIHDSPRYFIQNDINKAEQLIKLIAKFNTGKQIQVTSLMDQNFLVKRIHLRRYNYWTLTKYQSFGFNQYCTWVVMLLLGIVGSQAKYVFRMNQIKTLQTEIFWISCFQIVGIIASLFFLKLWYRKYTCLFTSFATAIVASILYSTQQNSIFSNLVLLGLNAVFSISQFAFLVVNCIEFYPHSIRGLGIGLMLSLFYMGQLLFRLYQNYKPTRQMALQVFMMGAWIMTLHCFGLQQTLQKGLSYEIKEIQQEENQQQI